MVLDRRLYLPELAHAWAQGVPMRGGTGDEVYGDAPRLRETVERPGRWYLRAVSSTTPIWTERPSGAAPVRGTGGRPRTKARLAPGAPPATTGATVVADWPTECWQRFAVAAGEKGPRLYDWGRARVIERRDRLPGPEVWLLARRSLSAPNDIPYYLARAPTAVTRQHLATLAATRDTVAQWLEEAKGESGLDQYEVRHWPSWDRHITLSMLAHAWLAAIRSQAEAQKGDVPPAWQV